MKYKLNFYIKTKLKKKFLAYYLLSKNLITKIK